MPSTIETSPNIIFSNILRHTTNTPVNNIKYGVFSSFFINTITFNPIIPAENLSSVPIGEKYSSPNKKIKKPYNIQFNRFFILSSPFCFHCPL